MPSESKSRSFSHISQPREQQFFPSTTKTVVLELDLFACVELRTLLEIAQSVEVTGSHYHVAAGNFLKYLREQRQKQHPYKAD